ncbi:uncharacterized protein LOC129287691 [Prosopis cineraria]|uniref:uncharacterized protein LOC129287691 n=1 Tax=Prosopis cineraria TaxID=364024 RepID=UPI002410693C|nr:uncharacterized protein LOC129287691 [Prosopis cineraria]
MGNSSSLSRGVKTNLYQWSSEKFREEYALIYTTSGPLVPTKSCAIYYRVNPDKLILTIDDRLPLLSNGLRVNMEFEAVRDCYGFFHFGAIKFKDQGDSFEERSIGTSISKQVLILKYHESPVSRFDRIDLYRLKKDRKVTYELVFVTYDQSGDYFIHVLSIHCDPWEGIHVNLSGPYSVYSGKKALWDTDYISGMPPDDVIQTAEKIRKDLKPEVLESKGTDSVVEAPGVPLPKNLMVNKGSIRGDNNCNINIYYYAGRH